MKFNKMKMNGGGLLAGFLILLVIVGGICYYYYSTNGGSGQKGDGYTSITTAQELMEIDEGGKYKLACDVDVSTVAWVPIDKFNGELDGKGFKIIGLNLDNNDSSKYAGMFRQISNGGRIHDISFIDVNISSSFSGAVAGLNGGKIENISVSGYVGRSNGLNCGGIAGTNTSEILNCENYASVSGQESIGGICGFNYGGTVASCENHGTIGGSYQNSGGIIGWSTGVIKGCTNYGSIESKGNYAGGICGSNDKTAVDSTNKGRVSGANNVAGCVASNNASAKNLQNYGDVEGNNYVGGTFARCPGTSDGCSSNEERSYTVTGVVHVGGFIAYLNDGKRWTGVTLNGITVIGSENVGGLIGYMYRGSISNSEFRGTILSKTGSDANYNFGGIVGAAKGNYSISNCTNYSSISVSGYNVGGILGIWSYVWAEGASVSNCINYGTVTTTGSYCAGIVGMTSDTWGWTMSISYCSNEATIHGYSKVYPICYNATLKGNSNTGSIIQDA